jgi:selenocysteine lyase/cysteine desulfurase
MKEEVLQSLREIEIILNAAHANSILSASMARQATTHQINDAREIVKKLINKTNAQ